MEIPKILQSFQNGEGLDYIDKAYETINEEKHEEFLKENEEME